MKMKVIYPCPACKGHGCEKCDKTGTLVGWNDRKVREAAEKILLDKTEKKK